MKFGKSCMHHQWPLATFPFVLAHYLFSCGLRSHIKHIFFHCVYIFDVTTSPDYNWIVLRIGLFFFNDIFSSDHHHSSGSPRVQPPCPIPPAALTPPAAPPGYRCRWNRPGTSSSCSECCPGEGWLTAARRSWMWRRWVPLARVVVYKLHINLQDNSLFTCGRKEAHHLHGQLKPLKIVL